MAKRKKKRKKNTYSQRIQLEKAHQKNQFKAFLVEVKRISEAASAEDVFKIIPPREQFILFKSRFRSPIISYADHMKRALSEKFLKIIERCVKDFTDDFQFQFPNSTEKFTLTDYLTNVLSINYFARNLEPNEFRNASLIKQRYKLLIEFCRSDNNPENSLHEYLEVLANALSRTSLKVRFYFEIDIYTRGIPEPYCSLRIRLNSVKAKTQSLNIDGHNRLIYSYIRLKNPPHIQTIRADLVQPGCPIPDLELDVYIQKHAVDRLIERIDCFPVDTTIINIMYSFENIEITPYAPLKVLMSFFFYGYKVGYFVLEVIDGIVLIRTFLFLTNDGTPEGKLLSRNIGLSKLDKIHNKLDKLSTFIHSDIENDEHLVSVLRDSNCDQILKLDDEIKNMAKKDFSPNSLPKASDIKKYLRLNDDDSN